jgi:hypothetical protein
MWRENSSVLYIDSTVIEVIASLKHSDSIICNSIEELRLMRFWRQTKYFLQDHLTLLEKSTNSSIACKDKNEDLNNNTGHKICQLTLLPKEALAAKDSQTAYLDCPPILLITDLV